FLAGGGKAVEASLHTPIDLFLFSFEHEAMVHRGRVMAYPFDSLGYAKRLRDGGVPQDQAEVHAEAARDFIMAEIATRADLLATEQRLRTSITDVQTELRTTKQELQTELRTSIEAQSLRMTVRLGATIVIALGALATILKLA